MSDGNIKQQSRSADSASEKSKAGWMSGEERFRLIMENVRDFAIFILNPEGRVVDWNAGAERLLGYSQDEAMGLHFSVIFIGDDGEKIAQHELTEAAETGRATDDLWHKRKDDTVFFANGITTALRDEQGGLRGFAKILRDMTDKKRMEEELRKRNEALAEADRRKDEFLAILGHELRNPLAPVFNVLHILKQEDHDPTLLQQAITLLDRQVRQLAILVDDLLDVNRITRGKIQLKKAKVELQDILDGAILAARPLIDSRQHDLSVSLPPDPIWLKADAARLTQVFTNILGNAAKYGKEEGRITVTAQPDNRHIVVRIQDTGVGIPPEALPHIFDLFHQAHQTQDQTQGGLGIGLTVAKHLVEMHGGTITASSDGLDKGSEFAVRLPLLLEFPQRSEGERVIHRKPSHALRILVVDDNDDAAESMAILLRMSGHEVWTAHCGPTGLQSAQDHKPEVILMDLGLPGLDGFQVARRLREHPDFTRTIIIAVSGFGQKEDRERAIEAGFDYHLAKPVDPQIVQDVMITLVEAKDTTPIPKRRCYIENNPWSINS